MQCENKKTWNVTENVVTVKNDIVLCELMVFNMRILAVKYNTNITVETYRDSALFWSPGCEALSPFS